MLSRCSAARLGHLRHNVGALMKVHGSCLGQLQRPVIAGAIHAWRAAGSQAPDRLLQVAEARAAHTEAAQLAAWLQDQQAAEAGAAEQAAAAAAAQAAQVQQQGDLIASLHTQLVGSLWPALPC